MRDAADRCVDAIEENPHLDNDPNFKATVTFELMKEVLSRSEGKATAVDPLQLEAIKKFSGAMNKK